MAAINLHILEGNGGGGGDVCDMGVGDDYIMSAINPWILEGEDVRDIDVVFACVFACVCVERGVCVFQTGNKLCVCVFDKGQTMCLTDWEVLQL